MAGAETVYTFRARAPVILPRGRNVTTSWPVYLNGALVAPTATGSTYSLVDQYGTEVCDGTVLVPTTTAQVALLAADLPSTVAYGEGYHERWGLVIDGVLRTARREALVARFELHPPLSDADLIDGQYPDLLENMGDYATHFQTFIDAAWCDCIRILVRHASWPDIVVEPSDVYEIHRELTLSRIFGALFGFRPDQRWQTLLDKHTALLAAAKAGLRIKEDRDRDGIPDSLERRPTSKQVHVNLPPRTQSRRSPWW